MTVDIFRKAFYNKIRTKLNRALVVGGSEGIVYREQGSVLVSNFCNLLYVGNTERWVARRFNMYQLCVRSYRRFDGFQIGCIYNRSFNVEFIINSTFPHQNFRKPQKKCGIEEIKILIKYEICSLSSTPSAKA